MPCGQSCGRPTDPEGLTDPAPAPAFVDLLERIDESGVEPAVIRQVGRRGEDGLPIGIDVAVTLARADP